MDASEVRVRQLDIYVKLYGIHENLVLHDMLFWPNF